MVPAFRSANLVSPIQINLKANLGSKKVCKIDPS